MTEAAWKCLYPDEPVTNMISARLTKTSPLAIPSLSSLISISPTPATPPPHNSPSNVPVNLTIALIASIHQRLQQNAAIMAHLEIRPSPPLVQPTPIPLTCKYQSSPFPKWDGTPPTTPLFLTQVVTYKSEAFYWGVNNWTRTIQANKRLRVVISANMVASLLQAVFPMFLNDIIFASDRISMLSCLLTHLNPYSSVSFLLAISYTTCLEMRLGDTSIEYMSRIRGISQRIQGVLVGK